MLHPVVAGHWHDAVQRQLLAVDCTAAVALEFATAPGVAVVLEVQRDDCGGCEYGGGGRVPTGELQFLWWDIERLTFTRSQHVDAQQASQASR